MLPFAVIALVVLAFFTFSWFRSVPQATVAVITRTVTETIRRRRNSPMCSTRVMASGVGVIMAATTEMIKIA